MVTRTPWQVTKSVWYALFMREVFSRMFANRYAWFWLFAEPILFVMVMVGIRTFLAMPDIIAGAPMIPWMIVGLTAFFMFRDGMTRSMGAINANKGLFAYRQVKPIDTVLVRCTIEGTIHSMVFVLFLSAMAIYGYHVVPQNFLMVVFAWGSMWLLGLSVGLIVSVITTIVSETSLIVNLISLPLMILSGAFLPLHFMPPYLQEWLLLNPIVHGVETLRLNFFSGYWSMSGIDLHYLHYWILAMLTLGLMLHIRFELKLKSQ